MILTKSRTKLFGSWNRKQQHFWLHRFAVAAYGKTFCLAASAPTDPQISGSDSKNANQMPGSSSENVRIGNVLPLARRAGQRYRWRKGIDGADIFGGKVCM